ncbi:hypothetical protein [Sulfurospirillum sp. hDNRA2]|uniref:hypothetical protein n=1 Tax=Sulfurospirillum sp. hDNRA2 TaxID=3237298 RepID=UPI0020B8E33B|nr:hypothetical protein [Sulfurospirillum sp. DNRA8]MCR1809846.1 hypothetical protein [Sulfurospirillum sp. DNRA8]
MEKIMDLLNRISTLYAIPQWIVNSGAITICIILVASPFVARFLMRPKYYKFREMLLFKVLWRWKYKKGDIIALWCYCPKCRAMLFCDDENCRTTDVLQDKITFFVCNECGGNELGRVVGGDRRYALSLVRRDIWRHIKDGTYNEVAKATKEALELLQHLEEERKAELHDTTQEPSTLQEAMSTESLSEEPILEKETPQEPLNNTDEHANELLPTEEASQSNDDASIPPQEEQNNEKQGNVEEAKPEAERHGV